MFKVERNGDKLPLFARQLAELTFVVSWVDKCEWKKERKQPEGSHSFNLNDVAGWSVCAAALGDTLSTSQQTTTARLLSIFGVEDDEETVLGVRDLC